MSRQLIVDCGGSVVYCGGSVVLRLIVSEVKMPRSCSPKQIIGSLRGCPCKNRPLDLRPKTEFLQIFRVRQLVRMINKNGNNLAFNISGDNFRGRYKTV